MSQSHLSFLHHCKDYESYLNSFVKKGDVYYLRNTFASSIIVKLGYRSTNLLTEKQFYKKKAEIYESLYPRKRAYVLFSERFKICDPFLMELEQRELPNVQKTIVTIIFMSYKDEQGSDISGYIDYEHRLRHDNMDSEKLKPNRTNWNAIFAGTELLRPKITDLSYYDWKREKILYNNSDNFIIEIDNDSGLMFVYRDDRRKIYVNMTKKKFKNNGEYSIVYSSQYGPIVFYDHVVRKKL